MMKRMISPRKRNTTLGGPSAAPKTRGFRNGFSALELMVAMAIVAVVCATAAPPLMAWNQNRKVTKDGRDFFSNLRMAKLTAIKEACDVVVNIDAANDGYTYFLDDGGPNNDGARGNGTQEGSERTMVTSRGSNKTDIMVPATAFGGSTTTGFNSRGIPLNNGGTVVFSRADLTDADKTIWYRVNVSVAGHVVFQTSNDSSDGVNGHWYTK